MMPTLLYGANIYANGIRQHYLRYGGNNGRTALRDPVIIIPGITSPAATWGFVGQRFGQYFDTYILDVRGRGLSEASATIDYSLDAQARDVIAFAQAVGLKRYSLLGHSMGGRIAVRAARMEKINTRAIKRLVMIDPPVSGPGRRDYPAQLSWYLDSMREARKGISVEAMRKYCPSWTNQQLNVRAQWLHTCDERAVIASFEGFKRDDVHADMKHIKVPTLLMTAGRGEVLLPQDIAEIKRLIIEVKAVSVPYAGHMIPWDDEAGFYAAFGDFLGVRLD